VDTIAIAHDDDLQLIGNVVSPKSNAEIKVNQKSLHVGNLDCGCNREGLT
jgi:hypothetical protein